MRKYTRTEGTPEVVSPEAHKAIQTELSKLARKSARDLSDFQRQIVLSALEESDETC